MGKSLAELVVLNLQAIAKDRNMSQTALAAAIGVSQQTVSNWLRGAHKMDTDRIDAIAAGLKVPLETLTREPKRRKNANVA